ncbi:alpha/beta fold hydrolase [Mobilicoccus sp.]|uniref:alpha/beta fold hydrolase n=1 Tax=Mobilicoccus sp. TaxID=2034349 RepID=UPI0028AF5390|nr:alpha/beta fold hydrolase [Mobilicoccus sp.]
MPKVVPTSVGLGERIWWTTATELATEARVVTFAMRGHGRSTAEVIGHSHEHTLHDMSALADHVGMARPAVVGYEFGGAIAELSVARFPDRFSAIGLVDSPVFLPAVDYLEVLSIFDSADLQAKLAKRFRLGVSGPDPASLEAFLDEGAAAMASDWNTRQPDEAGARVSLAHDTLVEPSGAWMRRPTIDTCAAYASLATKQFAVPGRELLAELEVPVWVVQPASGSYVHGFDEFFEFARGRDRWTVREIPGGTDVFYDGTLAREFGPLLRDLPR